MLLPDITSIRASDTTLAGIGKSADSAQSLGSLFDRTDNADRFQPSLFSNSALSNLYTERGTFASPAASLKTTGSLLSAQSGMTLSAITAYQPSEPTSALSSGAFPSPLAATGQNATTGVTGLFGLQFSQPGGMLDLLA